MALPSGLNALTVFAFVHLSALFAAGHAICYKRDSRSAASWVILIIFVPLLGTLLYFWIGINRVKRRALGLRGRRSRTESKEGDALPAGCHPALVVSGRINRDPLRAGNSLKLLVNGEEAYPEMLNAIAAAKHSVTLATYIFDNDSVGTRFATALLEAASRGVEVRVLVDSVGARYSFPSIFRQFRHAPATFRSARFLDTIFPWRFHYSQLRNHRKILVADGRVAFLGGMNIRLGHEVKSAGREAVQDLHFRCEGAVVGDIQRVFASDWEFSTRERLQGEKWFPPAAAAMGETVSRLLVDGPDEDFGKLRWTLLAAIATARVSIRILTPYFVPDQALLDAIGIAALRGVKVEIVLPEQSNVALVQWASTALLWQLLERGCVVRATRPPFDHSKLFLVDSTWALVGSANWDARSLRLNFELGLELENPLFVQELEKEFARKSALGREVTLRALDSRWLLTRLRDGTARLFSPYL